MQTFRAHDQNASFSFQNDPMMILREPNIFKKCELLSQHLNLHSPKELQMYFGHLVDNLFQTNLCVIDKTSHPDEYQALVGLLNPRGPVFQLAEKLTHEVAASRILLHIQKLPEGLRDSLVRNAASNFITHKVSLDGHYLQLSPVEYFLFAFIGHVLELGVAKVRMDLNNWPVVAYFTLFEQYLGFFLNPEDPCATASSSVLDTSNIRIHPCGRPVGHGHRCLLKKDTSFGANVTLNNSSLLSSSKASSLVNVVCELWFSEYQSKENQQLQRAMRMLFKKMHTCSYFEFHNVPQLRRRIYRFLKATLMTWPLDSTYRLPLEVWLTFVQPWRYCPPGDIREFYDGLKERFAIFLDEHFLFYTQLLLVTLDRICVLDLSLQANVVVISRIAKVFSQPALMTTVLERETVNRIQNSMTELDDTGSTFLDIQSDLWRNKAREILLSLRQGQARLEKKIEMLEESGKRKGWWSGLWESLVGIATPVSSHSVKILKQVKESIHHLAVIFRVELPELHDSFDFEMEEVQEDSPIKSKRRRKAFDERYFSIPEKVPPRENEFEILLPHLERWSQQLNSKFGRQIRDMYYRRNADWKAFIIMYLLSSVIMPPASYIEIEKERSFKSPRKHVEKSEPPRIYLRPLAKDSFIWLLLSVVGAWCLVGSKFVITVSLSLFILKVVIEKVYTSFYPPEDD